VFYRHIGLCVRIGTVQYVWKGGQGTGFRACISGDAETILYGEYIVKMELQQEGNVIYKRKS